MDDKTITITRMDLCMVCSEALLELDEKLHDSSLMSFGIVLTGYIIGKLFNDKGDK